MWWENEVGYAVNLENNESQIIRKKKKLPYPMSQGKAQQNSGTYHIWKESSELTKSNNIPPVDRF